MDKDIFSVSNSILIGSILIAVSIFLSGHFSLPSAQGKADTNNNTQPVATNPDTTTGPVTVKDRVGEPKEGSGKVTIVEFSDFQCPFCQSFFNNTYKQLKAKYVDTGKVQFIYRYFPLSFHVNAQIAAQAGECANLQGKFWQYHDVLFTKGSSDGTGLDSASLKSYAKDLGLDTAKFNSCLDNGDTLSTVKADITEGGNDGVSGTPTFFINGTKIVGALPYAQFEQAIDNALK